MLFISSSASDAEKFLEKTSGDERARNTTCESGNVLRIFIDFVRRELTHSAGHKAPGNKLRISLIVAKVSRGSNSMLVLSMAIAAQQQ